VNCLLKRKPPHGRMKRWPLSAAACQWSESRKITSSTGQAARRTSSNCSRGAANRKERGQRWRTCASSWDAANTTTLPPIPRLLPDLSSELPTAHPTGPEYREIALKRIDMIVTHDALARLCDIRQPSLVLCEDLNFCTPLPLSEEIAALYLAPRGRPQGSWRADWTRRGRKVLSASQQFYRAPSIAVENFISKNATTIASASASKKSHARKKSSMNVPLNPAFARGGDRC
jgi:hypothetical protein